MSEDLNATVADYYAEYEPEINDPHRIIRFDYAGRPKTWDHPAEPAEVILWCPAIGEETDGRIDYSYRHADEADGTCAGCGRQVCIPIE